MSYILEALRRSQAERERGQVPGLNAQPVSGAAEAPPRVGVALPRPVLALGLVLLLVALGAWLWRAAAPAAPAAVVVPAAVVSQAVPTLAVPAAVPAPAALPVVVSAPVGAAPTAAASVAVISPPALPVAPVQPAAVAPVAPVASRAAQRTLSLAELTPEQRRELPPLVMGGSIWSESALGRFVIVNGQVVREGEGAAPGVTVERIGPKAVLLRWRELRFEVPL